MLAGEMSGYPCVKPQMSPLRPVRSCSEFSLVYGGTAAFHSGR